MKVLGWKIYYADGSTYSSKKGTWDDAPSEGVQFVVIYFDELIEAGKNMRLLRFGGDYYWMEDTPSGPVFRMEIYDRPPLKPEEKIRLKKGSSLGRDEWNRIYEQALRDEDWEKA